ncbi:MAG: hypothetical protein ACFE8V_04510 [Promethearchaeota archaeon]
MKSLENKLNEKKYYRVISPSDIHIEREDIFYRDKYNDIMNYFKALLTSDDFSEIRQYVQPKGLLLVNMQPGTDIIDYLKLISKNYNLDFIDLDYFEILKSPIEFMNSFNLIFQEIFEKTKDKDQLQNESKTYPESFDDHLENFKPKRLILINQSELPENLFEGRSLLNLFLTYQKNYNPNYIKNGIILIWLNENLREIRENSKYIYQLFDLFIKIPLLDFKERELVLRNFLEKNPKIVFDINTIASYTKNWEILDINYLLKMAIFKHYINYDLNKSSNEVTDLIINLIESGEFFPSLPNKDQIIQDSRANIKTKFTEKLSSNKDMNLFEVESLLNEIQTQPISEFMLNQLYENAASKNYTELVIIIDKLNKNELLEENDRKLLSNYPFILRDSPNRAQIYLEKAKKKVDHIKQSFGK